MRTANQPASHPPTNPLPQHDDERRNGYGGALTTPPPQAATQIDIIKER